MNLSLERLKFDPTAPADGPAVGNYIVSKSGEVIDHTDVTGTKGLNVNVINPISVELDLTQADEITVFQGTSPWVVSATDLDIRDLSAAIDSVSSVQSGTWAVQLTDGVDTLAIAVDGSIKAVVSATDLDIRDLTQSDEITVYQGTSPWEISALDHTKDSVKLGDGTDFLAIATDGSIKVNDYCTSALAGAVSVGTTAVAMPATALTGRKKMLIQNRGSQSVFIGFTNAVTTASGVELSKGGSLELEVSAAVTVYGISTVAAQDVRVIELA